MTDVPDVKELPVLILAGGMGTRLRSVYKSGPKCMAPIAGRPFLEYLLRALLDQGVSRVLISVGYMKEAIIHHFGRGAALNMQLEYVAEETPLGTAGAIKNAEARMQDPYFVVLNGDSFLEVRLAELLRQHIEKQAFVTVATVRVHDRNRYGEIQMDQQGRILGFCEKNASNTSQTPHTAAMFAVNGGVYAMNREFLHLIESAKNVSLERDIFPRLTAGNCYGFSVDGYFIDIGIPQDLQRAQTELPERIRL